MNELLLVDGYNVIHAWPSLRALKDVSLEMARDALVARLAVYHQVNDAEVTVVFDAHLTQARHTTKLQHDGVNVLYTRAGSSADHAIERITYEGRKHGRQVLVATSDRFQRDMVRGMGGAVIDSPELELRVAAAEESLRRRLNREFR